MMPGSFTFTVGKLDAGMAILIGSRAHLIEFPSILLPDGVTVGSIVSIDVHRNVSEEEQQKATFWELQNDIYTTYGIQKPVAPVLKLRHVTQTSVTLEWPSLQLATASLRSLDIYRNGQRLATIPTPLTTTSTKLSSLQISTGYTFQLILRTTAGTFPSNVIQTKTHSIEDTSGISVCFGTILDSDVGDGVSSATRKEELKSALESMGAKWSDKIQIDTTHFVCTTSLSLAAASSSAGPKTLASEEPGVEYQKAQQHSIPIVQPDWILACYYGKKMVPTAPYYLGSTIPPLAQGHNRVQSISQRANPAPPASPPATDTTGTPPTTSRRTSSAAPPLFARPTSSQTSSTKSLPRNPTNPTNTFITNADSASNSADPTIPYQPPATSKAVTPPVPVPEENDLDDGEESPTTPSGQSSAARQRTGTMNKAFKFPPDGSTPRSGGKSPGLMITPPAPPPPVPPIIVVHAAKDSVVVDPKTVKPKEEAPKPRAMPEPPTPDLDSAAVRTPPGIGRDDGDEGEIVEVDLS